LYLPEDGEEGWRVDDEGAVEAAGVVVGDYLERAHEQVEESRRRPEKACAAEEKKKIRFIVSVTWSIIRSILSSPCIPADSTARTFQHQDQSVFHSNCTGAKQTKQQALPQKRRPSTVHAPCKRRLARSRPGTTPRHARQRQRHFNATRPDRSRESGRQRAQGPGAAEASSVAFATDPASRMCASDRRRRYRYCAAH
jgi:hypothetical protein